MNYISLQKNCLQNLRDMSKILQAVFYILTTVELHQFFRAHYGRATPNLIAILLIYMIAKVNGKELR